LPKKGVDFVCMNTLDGAHALAQVEGPQVVRGGSKEECNRGGWNYFIPSPTALALWLNTVGFTEIKMGPVSRENRLKAVATRTGHVDMLRAGLSRPSVR